MMDTARSTDVNLLEEGSTTMPTLRSLAEEGTLFTKTATNAPWTLPSHGSLFSGRYPSVHGAHARHKHFSYEPTLSTLLQEAGYHTVGVSNNTWISGEFGFDRGFDEFVSTWQLFQDAIDFGDIAQTEMGLLNQLRGTLKKFRGNPLKNIGNLIYGNFFRKRHDDGAQRTNCILSDRISEWGDNSNPFFLFVNYLEPHLEYNPPDEYAERFLPNNVSVQEARAVNQDAWAYITGETTMNEWEFEVLRSLYQAELAYLDKRIGELLDYFENAGLLDETVFLITGDHGENIGDHGLMDHQYSLYETLLDVPLVITGPGFDKGRRVDKPAQLLDLFPTILDMADVTFDTDDYFGCSLRDTDQLPDERAIVAEYVGPQPQIETLAERYDCEHDISRYDRRLWALKRGNDKYIRGSDGSERLFNLQRDRDERTDDSTQRPERCQALANELDEIMEALPESTHDDGGPSMDATTKQRLEDLGYLQ